MLRRFLMLILGIGLTVSALQCSSSSTTSSTDDGGSGDDTSTAPTISAALTLATDTSTETSLSARDVGQVDAEGLTSLKYYITSITICEDMETTGSGFSNPEGCLELYRGNQEDSLYSYEIGQDYAPFGDVARASDDGFVDLLDASSRATLNSKLTLTSDDVRSYNYGYINWYLPIKVTAEIDMEDGVFFRTNDGSTETGEDEAQGPITTATTDFTEMEVTEEAVVVHGNGGSWFRFQNPFEITAADIADNTQFVLDLAFNPDALVKGYAADIGGCGGCTLKDPSGNQLLVPMLDLTPVPHRASETVQKETYVATVESGEDNFDIRLELYSIEDDPDQTIYGINTATLINEDTTTAVSPFSKVSFVETAEDETLEFQDYNGEDGSLIIGFERQNEVGGEFTATLVCNDPASGGFSVDDCSDGDTMEVTFVLESTSALAETDFDNTRTVSGTVSRSSGEVSGLIVRAFEKDLTETTELGATTTDSDGAYLINYQFETEVDLVIRVYEADTQVAESETVFNASADATVDVTVP